jgi:hypothetical protein
VDASEPQCAIKIQNFEASEKKISKCAGMSVNHTRYCPGSTKSNYGEENRRASENERKSSSTVTVRAQTTSYFII